MQHPPSDPNELERWKEELRRKLDAGRDRLHLEPWYKDVSDELTKPEQVVVLTRYFLDQWAPLLGPTATLLLMRLRRYCYYNRQTGELRDWCFPSQQTLAHEIGIQDPKTLRAALKELERYELVRREAQYRYDPKSHRSVRTTDKYFVKMWDPVTPEDATILILKAVDRIVEEESKKQSNQALPPNGKKSLYGSALPSGQPPKGKKSPYYAREKTARVVSTSKKNNTHTGVSGGAQKQNTTADTARAVVRYFHSRAGHTDAQQATLKELEQAGTLVVTHGEEVVRQIIDFALGQAKETHFRMRHFGAVMGYVPEALTEFERHAAQREREAEKRRQQAEENARLAADRAAWDRLPAAEKVERRLADRVMIQETLHKRKLTPLEVMAIRNKLAAEMGLDAEAPTA